MPHAMEFASRLTPQEFANYLSTGRLAQDAAQRSEQKVVLAECSRNNVPESPKEFIWKPSDQRATLTWQGVVQPTRTFYTFIKRAKYHEFRHSQEFSLNTNGAKLNDTVTWPAIERARASRTLTLQQDAQTTKYKSTPWTIELDGFFASKFIKPRLATQLSDSDVILQKLVDDELVSLRKPQPGIVRNPPSGA